MLVLLILSGCARHHRVETLEGDAGIDVSADVSTDAVEVWDAFVEPPPCTFRLRDEVVVGSDTNPRNAPDLVWDGESFAVFATDGDTFEHAWVGVTRVSRDLSEVGETRRAGEETHGWGLATRLADDSIALAWSGDPGGPNRTMFRRIEGDVLTPRVDLWGEQTEAVLDFVTIGDTSLVGYRYRVDTPDGFAIESRVHVIDRDGVPITEPMTLHTAEYPGRTVRMATMGDLFVAAVPHDDEIEVLRLHRSGAVIDRTVIEVADVRHVVVAATADRVALAWRTGPRDARNLVFQSFDGDLRPLGPATELATAAPGASIPSLAAVPNGWTLVWGEGRYGDRLVLLHLDPNGAPYQARREVAGSRVSTYGAPATEVVDGELFMALARVQDERDTVVVQRWVCQIEPGDICAPQDVASDGCSDIAGWQWNGNACTPLLACACEGGDCDQLASTQHACRTDHAGCETACLRPREVAPTQLCTSARMHNTGNIITLEATVFVEGCGCEGLPTCEVSVDGPFAISVELRQCETEVTCDCIPPGPEPTVALVPCHLPPLGAGVWTVDSAAGSLDLQIVPAWEELPAPESGCTT